MAKHKYKILSMMKDPACACVHADEFVHIKADHPIGSPQKVRRIDIADRLQVRFGLLNRHARVRLMAQHFHFVQAFQHQIGAIRAII
jgi:hypothetical protein